MNVPASISCESPSTSASGSGPCAREKSAKIIDHNGLPIDASGVRRSGRIFNQLSFIGRFIEALRRARLGIRSRAITYTDPAQAILIDFFIVFSMTYRWLARPDGFEPPTTWFEARNPRADQSQAYQYLTCVRSCY
jgi:hypothetical protein